MEGYKKGKNESWDDYVWRMMEERQENAIEYDELYEILFNEQISNTEARKRLYGVKTNIVMRRENDNSIPENYMEKETFEMKSDGSHELQKFVSACEEDMKSPERIMEILGYDYLEWELVSSRHNRWNVYSKVDGKQLLYSLRAVVRPRKVQITKEFIENTINKLDFKLSVSKKKKHNIDYNKSGYMLEIPLMDVHFNKFTEARITGDDSNHKETTENVIKVVNDFLERSKGKNIKKIVFPIGQDYFNTDNKNGTTEKGTPQQNDLPHDLMFEKGVDLLQECIELCRSVAPVDVMYVDGNHDSTISYYATSALKRAYSLAGIDDVSFDILPKRKYVRFGKCLIGYTHGNKERKRIETENIMQKERRKDWGECLYFEWHMGHVHHEDVKEQGGIKYRKINSITSTDNWHYESGYVGALRMAQAFLWHEEYGLLDIMNSPII